MSARPLYTVMVLDLMSRVSLANGQAGQLVLDGEALVPIREWLATAIAPGGARYHQRRATAGKVRAALAAKGELPADTAEAERIVEAPVSERIRDTGMTASSRAVSGPVRAGLYERHRQGLLVAAETGWGQPRAGATH